MKWAWVIAAALLLAPGQVHAQSLEPQCPITLMTETRTWTAYLQPELLAHPVLKLDSCPRAGGPCETAELAHNTGCPMIKRSVSNELPLPESLDVTAFWNRDQRFMTVYVIAPMTVMEWFSTSLLMHHHVAMPFVGG